MIKLEFGWEERLIERHLGHKALANKKIKELSRLIVEGKAIVLDARRPETEKGEGDV